jgi:hypothetical protein
MGCRTRKARSASFFRVVRSVRAARFFCARQFGRQKVPPRPWNDPQSFHAVNPPGQSPTELHVCEQMPDVAPDAMRHVPDLQLSSVPHACPRSAFATLFAQLPTEVPGVIWQVWFVAQLSLFRQPSSQTLATESLQY